MQDGPPQKLSERTGRHYCVICLAEVPAEEYFRNELICDRCAANDSEAEVSSESVPQKDSAE